MSLIIFFQSSCLDDGTTNIDSLSSQAATTFNSYKSMGVIEMSYKFDIPIFTGRNFPGILQTIDQLK